MTEERDIVGRLNDEAMRLHGRGIDRGCIDSSLAGNLALEAAALIERLLEERERLREEVADYMGHRPDGVAGKYWAAQRLFSAFEDDLSDLIGDFDKLGTDDYDQSLEIYGVPEDVRLREDAQRLIRDAGFHKVYVNHGPAGDDANRWETHYTLDGELPVRGWRRRYVTDPSAKTDRVIAGEPQPGHYEISYWPEGWGGRAKADLERGYYRIVPDPLEARSLSDTGKAE